MNTNIKKITLPGSDLDLVIDLKEFAKKDSVNNLIENLRTAVTSALQSLSDNKLNKSEFPTITGNIYYTAYYNSFNYTYEYYVDSISLNKDIISYDFAKCKFNLYSRYYDEYAEEELEYTLERSNWFGISTKNENYVTIFNGDLDILSLEFDYDRLTVFRHGRFYNLYDIFQRKLRGENGIYVGDDFVKLSSTPVYKLTENQYYSRNLESGNIYIVTEDDPYIKLPDGFIPKNILRYTSTTGEIISSHSSSIKSNVYLDHGTLTFNRAINENDFSNIWPSNCDEVVTVEIPQHITNIIPPGFSGWSNLSSIYIPENVINISGSLFEDCYSLESIEVDENNPNYDSRNNCNAIILKSITSLVVGCDNTIIPNNITTIGPKSFKGRTGLTSIVIPSNITTIYDDAFVGCSNLLTVTLNSLVCIGYDVTYLVSSSFGSVFGPLVTEYILPEGLEIIGGRIFYGCYDLQHIEIPLSVTNIGYGAFTSCYSLTSSLVVPDTVQSVGQYAFGGVPNIIYNGNLNTLYWGARAVNGYVDGKLVFNDSSETTLLACFSDASGNLTIPNTATEIGEYAFCRCKNLDSITIPSSVTTLGEGAFVRCDSLLELIIPNSVYGNILYLCQHCLNLREVTISNLILKISASAFEDCPALETVNLPNALTRINSNAFSGDYSLFLTLPSNISDGLIESNAFLNIPNITYTGTVGNGRGARSINGYIENKLVYNNSTKTELRACSASKTGNIVISDSVETIKEKAFAYCDKITQVTLGNNVVSMGDSTFYNCTQLESIDLSSSLTRLPYYCFENCSSLSYIHIPENCTSIQSSAFEDCISLETADIEGGKSELGSYIFNGCIKLSTVNLPSGLLSLGYYIFNGCKSLFEINFAGTKSEFNRLSSSSSSRYWNRGSNIQVVHCSDGDINI